MKIELTEVAPRDGLQSLPEPVPVGTKIELVRRAANAGFRRVEVTSFVSPRAVPQLADAEAVLAGLAGLNTVTLEALVPNLRGAERVARTAVQDWVCFLSASESHSQANANCSVTEALARIEPVIDLARRCNRTPVAAIATAFGCPFEGIIPVSQTMRLVLALRDRGIRRIKFGDTIGTATPRQVHELAEQLKDKAPEIQPVLHLHDTRGLALPCVLAGINAGFTRFESSIGGIGGCPFAPGATGNVASEDLVHFLHAEGHDTGIDLAALIDTGRWLEGQLGRPLPARMLRVSPIGTTVPLPDGLRARG
ncbi:MAG: hydroxymethylglutaryl-CoA lyase [Rhodobacter sp.]|nr:hydroxymethylglutaryl-CoA lyase [Paracoccaceae bacterium]MCC0078165.1 hydroxymethylglutaryl-CoA lyase [Rhodobacter sp.]